MHSFSWAIRILCRLAHACRENALVVGRIHETGCRRPELGLQRPDLHGVTALAGRDVQSGHAATLCQYSGFACGGSGWTTPPGNGIQMALIRYTLDSVRSCVWVSGRSSLHPINTETRGITGWFEAATSRRRIARPGAARVR